MSYDIYLDVQSFPRKRLTLNINVISLLNKYVSWNKCIQLVTEDRKKMKSFRKYDVLQIQAFKIVVWSGRINIECAFVRQNVRVTNVAIILLHWFFLGWRKHKTLIAYEI